MKKFFKGLFIFILVIVLLVVVVVGGTYIALSDKTNDLDVSQYNNTATEEVLVTKLNGALDEMKDSYAIELTLTEAEINNLIYSFIKKNVNPNYNPVSGTTAEETNVYVGVEIPEEVALIGGETISVNSCYVEFIDDNIKLNVTIDGAGIIQSRIQVEINVETTEDEYILKLVTLKLGKINLISKGARKLGASAGGEEEANDYFKSNDIPFELYLEDGCLKGKKEEVNAWVISLLCQDGDETKEEFLSMLIGQKDALEIGMFSRGFGVKASLERLRVSEELTTLSSEITSFNETFFVTSKSQTYIVNKVSGNNYIPISELELNQLFYNNTNHYEGFGTTFNLLDGVSLSLGVTGVEIDLNETGDKAHMRMIVNLNGLKTVILVDGDSYINDGDIVIELKEKITVGQDYKLKASVLNNLIGNAMGEDAIMAWDSETESFVVSKQTLTDTLSKSVGSKMSVEALGLVGNGIRAYIATATSQVETTISELVNLAEDVLSGEIVNEETFDTTDPTQAEAVSTLVEELNNVSEVLTNPEIDITTENTDALIEAISSLSEENQQAFYDRMTEEIGQEELNRLYQQLFGGNN